jgi:hypothetical protein
MKLNRINPVNVQLPEKEIFSRLKYNIHKTEIDQDSLVKIKKIISRGFQACALQAVWGRCDILDVSADKTFFDSGDEIISGSIVKLLSSCHSAVFMAATVGPAVVEMASEAVLSGDGGSAVILDAVGSETAEAAIEWLNSYVGSIIKKNGEVLTSMRFSPGYGDFRLEYQKLFYEKLQLDKMGVALTDKFILVPEKTVTAIAGISG